MLIFCFLIVFDHSHKRKRETYIILNLLEIGCVVKRQFRQHHLVWKHHFYDLGDLEDYLKTCHYLPKLIRNVMGKYMVLYATYYNNGVFNSHTSKDMRMMVDEGLGDGTTRDTEPVFILSVGQYRERSGKYKP